MIVCPRCGKDNQDHYKFCLGCGAELPREQAGPRSFSSPATGADSAPPVGGSPSAPAPVRERNLPFAATQQGDMDMISDLGPRLPEGTSGGTGRPGVGQVGLLPEEGGLDRAREPDDFEARRDGPSLRPGPGFDDGGGRPLVRSTSSRPSPSGGGGGAASALAQASAPQASPSPAPAQHVQPVVAMRDCPACGDPVPADFRFCGSCGHRMDSAAASSQMRSQQPGAVQREPAEAPGAAAGSLVLINPDGSEGVTFPLVGAEVTVGRRAGGPFAGDSYLSPVHATFSFADGQCVVRDENSLNGVYFKIPRDTPMLLEDGSIFRIGQEILQFSRLEEESPEHGVEVMGSPNPGYLGRVALVVGRRSHGNSFLIPPDGAHIGRERGDVIFPEDGYVSGLHCRISADGEETVLTDVGSSNGTFMRLRGEHRCHSGELLLMGQQLFRLQF